MAREQHGDKYPVFNQKMPACTPENASQRVVDSEVVIFPLAYLLLVEGSIVFPANLLIQRLARSIRMPVHGHL
jgi:hypothetical protein